MHAFWLSLHSPLENHSALEVKADFPKHIKIFQTNKLMVFYLQGKKIGEKWRKFHFAPCSLGHVRVNPSYLKVIT